MNTDKLELNADLIRSINSEARDHSKPMPYTKADHKAAIGLAVGEIRDWNIAFPELEQYTKDEYSRALYFSEVAAIAWNRLLPDAEQFTKAEINKRSPDVKNTALKIGLGIVIALWVLFVFWIFS